MKKYSNIFTLLVLALISGLVLTACSEDDLDTNQYGDGVKLNAYGPNPVMRGGQLRFVGSNLDQIAQVVIPGVSPITSIDVVKAGVPSEIRITVPKDGPEVGYITLVSRTDGELRTASELTYTEPIEVTGFSPAAVMPGDVVTIEGDYLNLVHMVEFMSELQVSEQDFLYHDRYKIEVKVPEDARTGKIRLLDVDLSALEDPTADISYNVIETDEALIVGTPTISEFASPRGKAGAQGTVTAKQGETITITGAHFNLIGAVKFGDDGNIFELSDFTVSDDGKTLSFPLPAEAPDGSINLVCRSEVEVPVGTLVTVAPSACVAAPQPVKAGQPLTISGQDMDVVASVEMPNVSDAIAIQVSADKVIVSAVPETAQEGRLTLRMANGKGVEVPFTLVKPVVTNYNDANISAGAAIVMTGVDLDLVKSISFGCDPVDVTASADGTSITVTVPMEAVSGKPVLNLANGTTVEAPELNITEAVFCYITALPDEENTPEAGSAVKLPVKNGDVLTNVFVNGEEVRFVYDAKSSAIIFSIPQNATASSKVRLVSSNGEIEYTMAVIPAGEVENVIFNGPVSLSWSDDSRKIFIGESAFEGVPAGATLKVSFQQTGSWGQAQFNNGNWKNDKINFPELGGAYLTTDNCGGADATSIELTLTQDILDDLTANAAWGNMLIIQGDQWIITKISIKYKNNLEQDIAPFSLWEDQSSNITYPFQLSWSDAKGKVRIMRSGLAELGLKAGKSKLIIYKTPESTGQLQLNDPNWKNPITDADLTDWSGGVETLETVFTEQMMKCVTGEIADGWSETAFIIQGDGLVIKKITILP